MRRPWWPRANDGGGRHHRLPQAIRRNNADTALRSVTQTSDNQPGALSARTIKVPCRCCTAIPSDGTSASRPHPCRTQVLASRTSAPTASGHRIAPSDERNVSEFLIGHPPKAPAPTVEAELNCLSNRYSGAIEHKGKSCVLRPNGREWRLGR
jgi:hypothetical protein